LLKACIDTNVWLSGLAYSGPPAEIVTLALNRKFQIVTSIFMLDELERNLINKFHIEPRKAKKLIFRIIQIADVYEPKGTIKIIDKCPGDNIVLETAWIGRAKYLVTGDKQHLLPIRVFRNIKIIEPAIFLSLIRR
jgi:uncharacterized protein